MKAKAGQTPERRPSEEKGAKKAATSVPKAVMTKTKDAAAKIKKLTSKKSISAGKVGVKKVAKPKTAKSSFSGKEKSANQDGGRGSDTPSPGAASSPASNASSTKSASKKIRKNASSSKERADKKKSAGLKRASAAQATGTVSKSTVGGKRDGQAPGGKKPRPVPASGKKQSSPARVDVAGQRAGSSTTPRQPSTGKSRVGTAAGKPSRPVESGATKGKNTRRPASSESGALTYKGSSATTTSGTSQWAARRPGEANPARPRKPPAGDGRETGANRASASTASKASTESSDSDSSDNELLSVKAGGKKFSTVNKSSKPPAKKKKAPAKATGKVISAAMAKRIAKRKMEAQRKRDEEIKRILMSQPSRRVASLNASAMTQCMLENENVPRPSQQPGPSSSSSETASKPRIPAAETVTKPRPVVSGTTAKQRSSSATSSSKERSDTGSQSSCSAKEKPLSRRRTAATKLANRLATKKPRRRRPEVSAMSFPEMVVTKRLASLNASAIMTASYSPEPKRRRDADALALVPVAGSGDAVSAGQVKRNRARPRRARRPASPVAAEKPDQLDLPAAAGLLKDELGKVDLVVGDRDVTITGMHYVTTCTSTTCVTDVRTYRISSAPAKQRQAPFPGAEVVPTQAQRQGPYVSYSADGYAPLAALSSMMMGGGGPAAPPPPPPPSRPAAYSQGASHPAYSQAPPPHCYGYMQPAGPLIEPHATAVQPPVPVPVAVHRPVPHHPPDPAAAGAATAPTPRWPSGHTSPAASTLSSPSPPASHAPAATVFRPPYPPPHLSPYPHHGYMYPPSYRPPVYAHAPAPPHVPYHPYPYLPYQHAGYSAHPAHPHHPHLVQPYPHHEYAPYTQYPPQYPYPYSGAAALPAPPAGGTVYQDREGRSFVAPRLAPAPPPSAEFSPYPAGVADQTGAPPCSGAPPLAPLPPGDASGGPQPPELAGAPPPPAAAPEKRQMSAQPAHQGPVWQTTGYHPWQPGWPSATVTTSQVVTSPPQQSADADDAPVICEIGQMKPPARWAGAAVKSVTTAAPVPVVITTARSEAHPAPSPARTATAAPSATRSVAKVAPPAPFAPGLATSAPSPARPATTAPVVVGSVTSAPPASKPTTITLSQASVPSTLPPPTGRSGPQSETVAPPVRTAKPKEAPVMSPPQGTLLAEKAPQSSLSAVWTEQQATRGKDQSKPPPAHEPIRSQSVPARTHDQPQSTSAGTAASVAASADVTAARSSPMSGSAARPRPGAAVTTSSTPASSTGPGFNYLAVAAMPQCPPRHRRPILPRPFPGMSRPSVTSSTLMTSSLVSGAQVVTSPLGQMVVERSEYRAQLVAPPVRVFAENQVQIVELPNNAGSKANVPSDTRQETGAQLPSVGPVASSEPQLSQGDCDAKVEGKQAGTDGDLSSESARPLEAVGAVAQPKKESTSPADKPTLKRKDVEVKKEPPAKKAKMESLDGRLGDSKIKMRPVFKTTAAKREHDHLKTGVKTEKPKTSPVVSKVSTDNYSKTIDMVAKAKFKPSPLSPIEKQKTKPKPEKAPNLVTSTNTTNGEKSQTPKKRGRPKKLERSASESGSCTSEASSAASSRSIKPKKQKSSADSTATTQSNGTAKTSKEHRRKSSTDRLIVDVASLCGRRTPTDLKSRLSAPPPRLTDSPAPDAVRPKPRRPETEPSATGTTAAVRHKPRRPRVVPGLTARKSISPDLPAAEETAPAAARPPVSRRGRRPSSGSTGTERKRKRRQDRQPSGEGRLIIPRPVGGQRWSHAWSFQGEGQMKKILLRNDGQLVERLCYPSMRHQEGDEIALRDCVLLRAGGRDEMPFVGKVAAIFQNPEDNEMLVSLLWYYRPDSTDYGEGEVAVDADKTRPPNNGVQSSSPAEVFASRHRDTNSVACIEDKCFVLTWNEYCRYTKFLALYQAGLPSYSSQVPESPAEYPRVAMLPPARVAPDRVFFCKRVYDYRTKRILKNPMPAPANGN